MTKVANDSWWKKWDQGPGINKCYRKVSIPISVRCRQVTENNMSARRNKDVVREKVAEWQQQGAVMRLASPAWCTNPLSVAEKMDTQGRNNKEIVVWI